MLPASALGGTGKAVRRGGRTRGPPLVRAGKLFGFCGVPGWIVIVSGRLVAVPDFGCVGLG